MKYLSLLFSLLSMISDLISWFRLSRAKEEGRQEVFAAEKAADQKAKAVAQEISTRVDGMSDAAVDDGLRRFYRD